VSMGGEKREEEETAQFLPRRLSGAEFEEGVPAVMLTKPEEAERKINSNNTRKGLQALFTHPKTGVCHRCEQDPGGKVYASKENPV